MPQKTQKHRIGRLILDTFPYTMHVLMHDLDLSGHDPRLTKTQLNTLYVLHIHGRLNMSALSSHVNRQKGSFTSVVDSLERLGLIERRPDPKDRRVVNTELTPAGKKYMERARKIILEHLENKLHALTESERSDFREAVATINRITEKISGENK